MRNSVKSFRATKFQRYIMKSALGILISLSVVYSPAIGSETGSVDSEPYCANFDFLSETSTIKEVVVNALTNAGPRDGDCPGTLYKWVFSGFGYPSKCACMEVAPQHDIRPKDGRKCAKWTLVPSSDTLKDSWIKNYEVAKDFAPPNGWCPRGQYKTIIKADFIGAPKDTCFCIKNFKFFYPVPS